jgi:hypothetical protein
VPIDQRTDRDFANQKLPHNRITAEAARPAPAAAREVFATVSGLSRLLFWRPHRTLSDAATEAWSCSESLAHHASATEPAFLELGADLRQLHESAAELTGTIEEAITRLHASLTAHRIAGEDGAVAGAIQAVEAGVVSMDSLLAQLQTITACLHALAPQLESIGKVGVLLQSVAVCFAVESSRTTEGTAAFGSFVDEIRGLSGRIAEVERKISDGLAHACNVGSTALAKLERELGALRKLADRLAEATEHAAGHVQAKLDEIVTASAEMQDRSRQIARHTEDAVYHMQFGDIVRQKIEHTVAAISEVAALLRQTPARDRTALGEATRSLTIQAAQLEVVEDELSAAAQRLGTAFGQITQAAAGLVQDRETPSTRGGSFELQEMLGGFGQLEELLKQAGTLQEQAVAAGGEALSTAEQIAGQMLEVQAINREMHLLALNAIVKTAALGSSGATLEVLSMQVHDLYRQADAAVVAIDDQARSLSKHADRTNTHEASHRPASERLAAALGEIGRSAGEYAQTAGLVAEKVAAQNGHLHAAETRLSALAAFAEQLRSLRTRVLALRAELVRRGGCSSVTVATPPAEDDARYTMQSEREVHRRLASSGVSAAPPPGTVPNRLESPKAEPYPPDNDGTPRPAPDAAASPFGENVELF